ncbi:DUF4426 domain-containing protein [Litorivivens sp.]|uniref:DUF4426 domain-containing protein n=1 Tax=Litorivivens sp. TaxID=2020868 RepID=UPI003565500B
MTLIQRGLTLLLCLAAFAAQAEQKQRFDHYDVHYSIVNTTFLKPTVAKAYGIVRGDDRFILNISVRENSDDGDVARKADISGSVFNLIHRKPLDFKEVDEGDAIYYIAQFEGDNKETLDFTLSIQPETSRRKYKFQFNKVMYTGK